MMAARSNPQRLGDPAPAELRHYCRNPRCRMKLPAAVENVRKAFCCKGCHSDFYRTRCLVCEKDTRTDPLTGEKRKRLDQRKFCGRKCRAEAQKWPGKYGPPLSPPSFPTSDARSAHSTGLKIALEDDRAPFQNLAHWRWGGDGDRDHSLYDRDGLTIARVVLEGDGRYHLRKPIAIPRQAWAQLEEAKRGAENFALMAMPLEAVDPKVAARIKHDNATPHPMGPPLNRPPLTSDATSFDWRPTGDGAGIPDIPDFLRRRPR
jgi:hypothetical protein